MEGFHANVTRLAQLPIPRAIGALAWPIVLSDTLYTGYQLVNAFWVGRLGATAFASVSVGLPVVWLLSSLGTGLSAAGAILVAQYAGARDQKMVNCVSAQTMLMVTVASAVFSAIGCATVRPILQMMSIGPDVFEAAARYLTVSLLGMVFTFGFAMFQSILRAIGEVKAPLCVLALSVFLNLLLDPLFIFGLGPVPSGGVIGAAYATLVAEGVAAAVGFVILFAGQYGVQVRLRDFVPDIPLSKNLLFLTLPASVEQSTANIGWAVMTMFVSSFGTEAIAAFGIGIRVLNVTIIPAVSISVAVTTMVGQYLGAGDIARARETGIIGAWYAFWLLTGVAMVVVAGAEILVRFFVPHDPTLVREGATVVRFIAASLGFFGAQISLMGALRGAGDTFVPMILAIISVWAIQLPMAYGLSHYSSLGVSGLWYSFPLSAILTVILMCARFATHRWKSLAPAVNCS